MTYDVPAVPERLHSTLVGVGMRPVVFLHGLFGQGINFTTLARGLGDLATCWLIDLPNHGRSFWTDTISYDAMADAVADKVARLPAPVILIGHSMGGRVAMRLALRRPDLVRSLAVLDTSVVDRGIDARYVGYVAAMNTLPLPRLRTRDEADAALAPVCPDPAVRALLLQNLYRTADNSFAWRLNLEVLSRDLAIIGSWPPMDARFHGRTWWLVGENSERTHTLDATAMRYYFPLLRQVVIKGAGHWLHTDAPEVTLRVLRAFLTQS